MALSARQRTRWIGLLIGVAVLVLLGIAWWPKPIAVQTFSAREQPLAVERVDQGYARVRELYLITAPVAGNLSRIELEPGDAVIADTPLTELAPLTSTPLDPRARAMAEAAVGAARAQVQQAEALLSSNRDLRERSEQMFVDRLIPERDLTAVRAAERESEARLAAARASLRQAQANAAWDAQGNGRTLALRAPISGVVLKRYHESAGAVAAGTPLLELGDPNDLEIVAEFLSQEAAGMNVGARAQIEAWGGPPIPAEVSRVEPLGELKISALGVEERRVRVILALKAPAPKLGHGYQVDARVTVLDLPNVLVVPLEALQRDGADWRVWTINDDRATPVPVTVGANDGRYRQILSGLSAGQAVLVNPPATLVSGDRVAVAP